MISTTYDPGVSFLVRIKARTTYDEVSKEVGCGCQCGSLGSDFQGENFGWVYPDCGHPACGKCKNLGHIKEGARLTPCEAGFECKYEEYCCDSRLLSTNGDCDSLADQDNAHSNCHADK